MKSSWPVNELQFTFRRNIEQDVRIYISTDTGKALRIIFSEMRPDKVFIISDQKVGDLYADKVVSSIQERFATNRIIHAPDERHKNLQQIDSISNAFFASGGTSKSCIVALGGGITGNMAGLFATLAFRGLPLIHVPTTLLAQVDSAADVKQSVNAGRLKNSLGAYKAPDAVIINPVYCQSLSDRELRAGLGEAIKHGFAQDLHFVERIVSGQPRDLQFLTDVATTAISLKIEHWHNTPTIWNDKKKVERLTHLGHTVGKILEMIEVDYLTHGEAISHGMIIEAYASHFAGYLSSDEVEYMQSKLRQLELLYPLSKKYTRSAILSGLYPQQNLHPIYALLRELGNPNTVSTTLPKATVAQAIQLHLDFLITEGLFKQ